jgi:hypothetical protein
LLRSCRVGLVALLAAEVACTTASSEPSSPVKVVVPESGRTSRPPERTSWFSGIITSEILISEPIGNEPQVSGQQQFFISGNHLFVRETTANGLVHELTYDPERNVLYQLAPEPGVVHDDNQGDVELSFSGQTRTILGYSCRELVRREPQVTTRAWVATELRVDPAAFEGLTYRGFAKSLEFSGGALELAAEIEFDDHMLYSRAVHVERRSSFVPETWKLPQ